MPNQPPIQRVSGLSFPGRGKGGSSQCVKLTTNLHLVPRLTLVELSLHSPSCFQNKIYLYLFNSIIVLYEYISVYSIILNFCSPLFAEGCKQIHSKKSLLDWCVNIPPHAAIWAIWLSEAPWWLPTVIRAQNIGKHLTDHTASRIYHFGLIRLGAYIKYIYISVQPREREAKIGQSV